LPHFFFLSFATLQNLSLGTALARIPRACILKRRLRFSSFPSFSRRISLLSQVFFCGFRLISELRGFPLPFLFCASLPFLLRCRRAFPFLTSRCMWPHALFLRLFHFPPPNISHFISHHLYFRPDRTTFTWHRTFLDLQRGFFAGKRNPWIPLSPFPPLQFSFSRFPSPYTSPSRISLFGLDRLLVLPF